MEKYELDKLIGKTVKSYEFVPEFSGDNSDHEVILHFTNETSVLLKSWATYADESGLDIELINMTALQYIEHLNKEAKSKQERAIAAETLRRAQRKKQIEKAKELEKLIQEDRTNE